MTDQNLSRHRTAFTVSIEAKKGVTTGISAKDRAETIRVAVSPQSTSKDLVSPGHVFPLLSSDGGVLERAGHTEAAVDLSRLAIGENSPYGVICEIMNDDGSMARMKDLVKFCKKHNLKMSSIKDLIEYKLKQDKFVKCIKVDEVMLNKSIFKMYVYKNLIDKTEHLAFVKGAIDSKKNITLIWNDVDGSKFYNIYRDGVFRATAEGNSFIDKVKRGQKYCYEISCVDQYDIESDKSNKHCKKLLLDSPKGLTADADVNSMKLSWDSVQDAAYYMIYEKVSSDEYKYIGESTIPTYKVKSLDFSANMCYSITAIDKEEDESQYSMSACNRVFDPPHFTIQSHKLIEPSGNGVLDARENGSIQFAIFNDGQSPAYNIIISVLPVDPNPNLVVGAPIILDTLKAGRIKFVLYKDNSLSIKGIHPNQLETSFSEFFGTSNSSKSPAFKTTFFRLLVIFFP